MFLGVLLRRLYESALPVQCIREGFFSVIPAQVRVVLSLLPVVTPRCLSLSVLSSPPVCIRCCSCQNSLSCAGCERSGGCLLIRLFSSVWPHRLTCGCLRLRIALQSLALLSWEELELRVCGRPTVDVEVLKKHTVRTRLCVFLLRFAMHGHFV
jgi:hypothetical protein